MNDYSSSPLARLAREQLLERNVRAAASSNPDKFWSEPITLERILTHEDAFGLTTATPLQRAICRIADGLPLGDLATHPHVVEAIGETAGIPLGRPPAELMLLSGIRTGKSLLAAALAVRASQTCDISRLGPGETARVSVLSPRLDLSRVIFGHLVGNLQAKPALGHLLMAEPTADAVVLRHPSGRPVEIKCVAGARAGATLVARWSAGAIFDEAPRMIGAEDGVVNFDDARAAVIGRLLAGAQLVAIGSPWAPQGPIYDAVREYWGKPSTRLVVVKAVAYALNPSYWTPTRCEDLKSRDPVVYRTDVLGEFADPESSLFASSELDAVTRQGPAELPYVRGPQYVAAMDPGTRSNSWTLCILRVDRIAGYAGRRYRVVMSRQWTGNKVQPLSPRKVLAEAAAICNEYGIHRVATDQFSVDALRDLASDAGIELDEYTITAALKLELFEGLHTRVAAREVELPPDPLVRSDLLSVRRRVTNTGVAIMVPHTSDGRHADHASSIALAVHIASNSGDAAPVVLRGQAFDDRGIDASPIDRFVGPRSTIPRTTHVFAGAGAIRFGDADHLGGIGRQAPAGAVTGDSLMNNELRRWAGK